MVGWLSKVLKTKQSLESSASQNPESFKKRSVLSYELCFWFPLKKRRRRNNLWILNFSVPVYKGSLRHLFLQWCSHAPVLPPPPAEAWHVSVPQFTRRLPWCFGEGKCFGGGPSCDQAGFETWPASPHPWPQAGVFLARLDRMVPLVLQLRAPVDGGHAILGLPQCLGWSPSAVKWLATL